MMLPLSIVRYMTPALPAPDRTAAAAWRALEPHSSHVSLPPIPDPLLESLKFEGFLTREVASGGVMLSGALEGEAMVALLVGMGDVTVRSRSEPLRTAILTVVSHMLKS